MVSLAPSDNGRPLGSQRAGVKVVHFGEDQLISVESNKEENRNPSAVMVECDACFGKFSRTANGGTAIIRTNKLNWLCLSCMIKGAQQEYNYEDEAEEATLAPSPAAQVFASSPQSSMWSKSSGNAVLVDAGPPSSNPFEFHSLTPSPWELPIDGKFEASVRAEDQVATLASQHFANTSLKDKLSGQFEDLTAMYASQFMPVQASIGSLLDRFDQLGFAGQSDTETQKKEELMSTLANVVHDAEEIEEQFQFTSTKVQQTNEEQFQFTSTKVQQTNEAVPELMAQKREPLQTLTNSLELPGRSWVNCINNSVTKRLDELCTKPRSQKPNKPSCCPSGHAHRKGQNEDLAAAAARQSSPANCVTPLPAHGRSSRQIEDWHHSVHSARHVRDAAVSAQSPEKSLPSPAHGQANRHLERRQPVAAVRQPGQSPHKRMSSPSHGHATRQVSARPSAQIPAKSLSPCRARGHARPAGELWCKARSATQPRVASPDYLSRTVPDYAFMPEQRDLSPAPAPSHMAASLKASPAWMTCLPVRRTSSPAATCFQQRRSTSVRSAATSPPPRHTRASFKDSLAGTLRSVTKPLEGHVWASGKDPLEGTLRNVTNPSGHAGAGVRDTAEALSQSGQYPVTRARSQPLHRQASAARLSASAAPVNRRGSGSPVTPWRGEHSGGPTFPPQAPRSANAAPVLIPRPRTTPARPLSARRPLGVARHQRSQQ